MKYVSWMKMSTGVAAMKMPDRPPMMNIDTNEIAQSVGTSKRIEPFQSVPSQLKTLIELGSAIIIVATMKAVPRPGFMPDWNMWWAHTMKPRPAMPAIEKTIAL